MDNRLALDPANSVVVEACAGSGKTWLLVSRVVRLLLEGVPPGEILAITFTRKAALEMQARLRDWLYDLASRDDAYVRDFLRQREVIDVDAALPRARRLYQEFLLAKPAITVSTFHGWFMQILQRAPASSGSAGGVQLLEKTAELWNEAWQTYLEGLHENPHSEVAQSMMFLFRELGLANTQSLLRNFVAKRSEWWAYTAGQGRDALDFALQNLRAEFDVDMESDPCVDLFESAYFYADVQALAACLDGLSNASAPQKARAERLRVPLDGQLPPDAAYALLWDELFTKKNEPRAIKANKGQDELALGGAVDRVREQLQAVFDQLRTKQLYLMNSHGLRCGVGLLKAYQELKKRQQSLDFGDLEWRVCQLLNNSDQAEYLQYKLDSRYRHVLLDEFQDTNPLQWQILQSWFAASKAVDSTPTVFVVGDPKQSIYRFRRADARLFDVVRRYLVADYGAVHLKKNETRRNSPAVLDAVNGVFDGLSEYPGFVRHVSHQQMLPGHVEVLPLADIATDNRKPQTGSGLLRNPLLEARADDDEGAREIEAEQFAVKLRQIVGAWQVNDEGGVRTAEYADIMVLVRRRTHLKVYEQALRRHAVPFLTSRRGGLLDTLEASDIQSLLTFLITPFADLALAQALRTPIFSCSDEDLMQIAGSRMQALGMQDTAVEELCTTGMNPASRIQNPTSWWQRLKYLVANDTATPALQRAHGLLQGWILLADKLPVHDLLDRIYFEGDAQHRYAAAVPEVMRATVLANLQAFLEIALNIDAGRYPSLPGFLRELAELRRADDSESPDEGKISQAGNAVRIYTVHEAKGLEAPVVWLLDANAKPPADRGFDVLVDWPTDDHAPSHFSLYGDKASRGKVRERYFEQEAMLAQREDLNLLYVAMTRAKQALLVSGSSEQLEGMWYQRIADAVAEGAENPLVEALPHSAESSIQHSASSILHPASCILHPVSVDARLSQVFPVGIRKPAMNDAQRQGVWLHALMQHLVAVKAPDYQELQKKLHIPQALMEELWRQAQDILNAPHLARFFDEQYHLKSSNEAAYVDSSGQLRRIDRLVEFENEVWVLDYKTGFNTGPQAHRAQLEEYRFAMQAIHPHKQVRCALIFADGNLTEV